MNHLAGKRFVVDANVEQDVTSWLQTMISFTQGYESWCHGGTSA